MTSKSDVYSFGVVLLEMLTGRRALDKNRSRGEHNLVEWVKPYLSSKHRTIAILDPRIQGQYSTTLAHKAANLAAQCVAIEPGLRPNMNQVVSILEQLQEGPDAKGSQRPRQNPSVGDNYRRKSTNDLPDGKGTLPRRKFASRLYV